MALTILPEKRKIVIKSFCHLLRKIDKKSVLTQDAAKAAGDAAKNLLGGIGAMGGSLLGKAAQAATVPPGQQQVWPLSIK